MIILILYIIGIRTLLVNIFEQRTFSFFSTSDVNLFPFPVESDSVILIGRITTILFILLCAICIFIGLINRKFQLPIQGLEITCAGLLLYIPVIVSSLVSENGGFSYKLFFFPLFIIAAYLSPRFNPIQKIEKILPILLLFLYSSLFAMLINANWAWSSYTDSWIGLPIRLYGTSSHPNGLAGIALVCIILSRLQTKHTFWFYLNNTIAILIIVLSQSKSVWITIIIWLFLEWLIKNFSTHRQFIVRFAITIVILFLIIATYILIFQKNIIFELFDLNITLNGRVNIWQITIDTWLNNPIFGYGPNLWNLTFRQGYGYLWAGQAHNQFLQTLGESGLFGICALLVYFVVITKVGSKFAFASFFSTFGIVIALVIRSFFESPFSIYNIDESFLIHAVFFVILLNSEFLNISNHNMVVSAA
jgi:exopolysaccharide production protein ExoQ